MVEIYSKVHSTSKNNFLVMYIKFYIISCYLIFLVFLELIYIEMYKNKLIINVKLPKSSIMVGIKVKFFNVFLKI